jgi:hypothetical protein
VPQRHPQSKQWAPSVPACMRSKRSSDSVAYDPRCGRQRGDCKRGGRSSAQAAPFRFSRDSGPIDASRRLATKWADARRGAEHGKLPELLRRSPPISEACCARPMIGAVDLRLALLLSAGWPADRGTLAAISDAAAGSSSFRVNGCIKNIQQSVYPNIRAAGGGLESSRAGDVSGRHPAAAEPLIAIGVADSRPVLRRLGNLVRQSTTSLADESFAEDDGELGLGLRTIRAVVVSVLRRASSRVSRFGRRAMRRSDTSGIGGEAEVRGLRSKRR